MLKQKFKTSGHPKVKLIPSKQQGFSLMEVLIAMIIIAIGLLGFLSLQLASINSNQDGLARTQATLIAQELGSALRANRDYIFSSGGNSEYLVQANYENCDVKPACSGAGGLCLPSEQARVDAWQACQTIKGFTTDVDNDDALLNGQVRVGCTDRDASDADVCSPGSTLHIYTFWANNVRREDVGSVGIPENQRCNVFAASIGLDYATIGDPVDCLVIDIMP
ncbi:type IV pilus modification protein PilV [Kangiella aquimarina]|uniref:Type IV pilus modification protein PilV n=1 Tax=Kangiella aquimarina TaxID=261965 RepID=A0ABZ0X2Y6_9GAMM|nr:type IV pilus modification protein PilV [Kangiella aquimarina]WQG84744.1 type IV pilus modification protein PilV [Kangiella aquimarina]